MSSRPLASQIFMNKILYSIAVIIISIFIAACAPSSPMELDLEILQAPIVGEAVDLRIVLRSFSDAPNTFLEITIPEGIQIVQGDPEILTPLIKNKKFTYQIKILVLKEGEYLISAYAFNKYSEDADSAGFGAGETIYVFSDNNTAQVLLKEDFRSQTPIGPCLNCETLGVDPALFGDD